MAVLEKIIPLFLTIFATVKAQDIKIQICQRIRMMGNFWHREKTTCAVLLTLTGTLWILPIVRMETCNPSLKVRPVVSITSSPKNNRLRIGASMNLTCTAQPRDADSVHLDRWVDYIEWYDPQGRHVGAKCKQPSNIHAHRPKLSCPLLLKNLTVDSLGFYTCQAGNGYTKHCTRKSVRITEFNCSRTQESRPYRGPPKISSHLTNQSLPYNSSLQLDCVLRACPKPEVLWTKDGVNIGNKNTFTIRQARLEDSGQYTCSATNSLGNKTSTIWIEIIGVSPQIIAPPTDQSVTEGYPVNLSCVASGVPTPTFVWDFNNGVLPSGIHQSDQEGESLLELPRATKKMEGTYNCIAKNKEHKTSSSAVLRVYGKASAQVVPETHQTLTSGEVLTLICKVNNETVNIKWQKDGESLKERAVIDTRLDERKSKLIITEVEEEDSGEYSCEVSNKLGTAARSSVTLDVKAAPAAPSSSSLEWYYIGGPVAALIFLLSLNAYIRKRRATALQELPSRLNKEQDEVEMGQLNANTDEWEIAVDRLNFREPIDRGAFGSVWRALLGRSRGRRGNRTVAAKCYLHVEEGETSKPETHAADQGAAAVQSVKEAGGEEPNTCRLVNTEDEQDDIGRHMEDQGDAEDFCDEEVGVQESNGYQLTAVDTDETGNDEDEESSDATPLVQD